MEAVALDSEEGRALLDKLPRAVRRLLLLRFLEEHTLDEMAHILGIPLPTVADQLLRASVRLIHLRKSLRKAVLPFSRKGTPKR